MNLGNGYQYFPDALDRSRQIELVVQIRRVLSQAPLFTPQMPGSGKSMSVRMSNCGPLGWVSDRDNGYRYQNFHPGTGQPWPEMPEAIRSVWLPMTCYPAMPEACLINYYAAGARMGLHKDQDEDNLAAPILSISLGDDALFRMGGQARGSSSQSLRLRSGDVLVMAGDARLSYHGIDRIYPGTCALLDEGGRFNLTLRRVHQPD